MLPTIGLLSTWPVYWGTTIDRHGHELMKGICAAGRDRRCNLLLGVGISPGNEPQQRRAAWPVVGPATDFVPVGPWNTDGLIILADYMSPEQSAYVADLQASGIPVVFTTDEGPGPRVVADNANGIRAAVRHLVEHGHERIAFVAGTKLHGGDSAARLRAFHEAMQEIGLPVRPRLVAFGEHNHDAGRLAMRQILAGGSPFTAFVASNDLSCLGAIEALNEAGLRVPDDVAAIGFDDILDARSLTPPLTTVRHASFALGYQAVETLLDLVAGRPPKDIPVIVPTRLVVRRSCGCDRDSLRPASASEEVGDDPLAALSNLMAEVAYLEARQSTPQELAGQCRDVVHALHDALEKADDRPLRAEIGRVVAETEARGEDPYLWECALSELHRCRRLLVDEDRGIDDRAIRARLDQARIDVSEHIQRGTTRALLEHMDMMSQVGLLTSRLLEAHDATELADVLGSDLPRVGLDHCLVATYRPAEDEEDPVARSEIALCVGLASGPREPFATRDFPAPGLYPPGEPVELVIVPLRAGDATSGFAAMSATNLEAIAAIVSNLGAAIRAIQLYREALEGRRLAEDASQLKSRFLSMVSHELRTPLSMIVGLSDMVVRETAEGSPLSTDAARDLAHMSASAQHLARLIGDVLDLASSQVGQLQLVSQRVDLAAVLLDASMSGEQMAREKGLEWRARLPSSAVWVMGDATRLRQIVLNLIGNAVKFTDSGCVTIDASAAGGEATISVSDTGVGIPADELAGVFDEFHRSREVARRGLPGMGLGLAIARQLAQRHGGSIGVRSPGDLGSGATFWVKLPTVQPGGLAADSAPQRPDVLLVAPAGADTRLGDHLRDRGFEVRVASVDPANDWSTELADRMPSALLIDDRVAEGRGWDLVRQNVAARDLQRIPVLACRLDAAADSGGFVDLTYLMKPLQAAELAVELGRRRLDTPADRAGTVILAVDDDPEMLELQARVIRSAGAWPIKASNGRDGLVAMAEAHPDLVLLDLAMPEMDGFEFLEAMRSDAALRDTPVIVVTGREVTEAELGRLGGWVAAILSKGVFTSAEVAQRIESVLSRTRALAPATQRLVRRATAFIEEHYAEPIGRDDIARHVAITADYLTDCFHQELGITPITYLNRYRIRRATQLLETTELPVTEVAMSCGFSDVSYFIRTFHREIGVSPRAYRRRRPLSVARDPT